MWGFLSAPAHGADEISRMTGDGVGDQAVEAAVDAHEGELVALQGDDVEVAQGARRVAAGEHPGARTGLARGDVHGPAGGGERAREAGLPGQARREVRQ